jgi:hypothetical protein
MDRSIAANKPQDLGAFKTAAHLRPPAWTGGATVGSNWTGRRDGLITKFRKEYIQFLIHIFGITFKMTYSSSACLGSAG